MTDLPSITVIVLTKNSISTIRNCLTSIVKQDYPNFDVLVLDDISNDGTTEIVFEFVKQYPFVNIGTSDYLSIGAGRQYAVEKAKGEYIAFVDSDVELPHKLWLREMAAPLTDNNVAGAWTLGTYKNSYPNIAKYAIMETDFILGEIPEIVDKQHYITIGMGHTVLKKSLVFTAGGFKDMIAGEDRELSMNIVNMGYIFKYINHRAFHLHATSYDSYMRKYARNLNAPVHTEGASTEVQKPNYLRFIMNFGILPIPVGLYRYAITGEKAWLWHPVISYSKCLIVIKKLILK